jgi:serpin B
MKKKILMGMAAMMVLMSFTGCILTPPQLDDDGEVLYQIEPPADDELDETDLRPDVLTDDEEKMMGDVDTYHDNDPDINKCLSNAAFRLLSEVEPNDAGNVLISPYSIDSALGMTEFGAEGETMRQLEATVNGNADVYGMAQSLNIIREKMESQEDAKWNIANSIWMKDRDDVSLRSGFLNDVDTFYGAEIYTEPFDNGTKDKINGWVDEQTNHMIPQIIEEINPDAISYLVNAVAFESEWYEQYEESAIRENMEFTNADGSVSDVTMLYSTESDSFEYAGSLAFAKPYKGGDYYFVGIVPGNDGYEINDESVEEYLQKMVECPDDFTKAFLNRTSDPQVDVMIPEFTMDYDTKLADTYKEMGMTVPFDENQANFRNMFDAEGEHHFWINEIIHKTHIEVDRQGTKAAAATVVEMNECTAIYEPVQNYRVYMDRPFVYAIVDGETGMPIFIGYVNNL